ncbi:MAG TPA: hypothetical protein VN915_07565 [Elusimicrobiota bacterium]|nr:hypothetical protein [Elusimicrobiota bacterium]
MTLLLAVAGALIPLGLYLWTQHKTSTPSLQWPALAKILNLQYDPNPPRMSGAWNGRRVAFETTPAGVTVTAWLNAATSLRVECAEKELVTRRAGLVVQDPVEPIDRAFGGRLLARCSGKSAGPTVFDAALQQRLAALPHVDLVGEDTRVVWTLPVVKDPDGAEGLLGALCAVADGLESFPRGGKTLA